jgi:pimeloyl-ACP methyl ester carboxylesterase
MGALIALDLAVRHSPLVAGIGVFNGIYRRSRQATDAILQRVEELQGDDKPDPTKTLERWFGKAPQGHIAKAATQCRHWLNSIDQQGYAAAYSAFARADAPSDEALRGISCPALFMTGELEPNSTPAMSRAISALVVNARCEVVKNAKHMMSLTHADEVNNALVNYFNGR